MRPLSSSLPAVLTVSHDTLREELDLTKGKADTYDALEVNDSAVKVLGEPTLKIIAKELVDAIRRNVTFDWTEREAVRARLRIMVKRIFKRYMGIRPTCRRRPRRRC